MDEHVAAAAIIAAGIRVAAHGLIAGAEGNLSVRLSVGRILVTPSGQRKDELRARDLVIVDLDGDAASDGRPTDRRPTSDLAIHRAVYRARPDVGAIVHAHVPAAMALTLAGETPDPAVLPETAVLLSRLPIVPYEAMGSAELAARIAVALTAPPAPGPDAALLERHGAIAVGSTVEAAVDRMDLVDVLCRVWRDARLLAPDRSPRPPEAGRA